MTDTPGEEGGPRAPAPARRPEEAPTPPPVEILGHATRPGQPTGAPAPVEGVSTGGAGIPAAPPAGGLGTRFTPPAPPARHLHPFTGSLAEPAPAAPPAMGATSRPVPAREDATPRFLQPDRDAFDRPHPSRPGRDGFDRPQPRTPEGFDRTRTPQPGPDGFDRPQPRTPEGFERALPPAGTNGGAVLATNGRPPAPVTGGAPGSPRPELESRPPARAQPEGSTGQLSSRGAAPPALPPQPVRQPLAGQIPTAPVGPGTPSLGAPPPSSPGSGGGSPTQLRPPSGGDGARPIARPHPDNGAIAWRPLPEPALASPRPTPSRSVGRLASLAPDPEPQAPMRPAPAPPRTAQDFAPDRVMGPLRVRPATRGWRRVVRSMSLGAIAPGPGRAERRERELVAAATVPIATCRRVAIVSRKGGIGKTTTTLMLGHTLAEHRGDRVVALDANPDAGSLAYRVRRETDATVTQLLRASDRIRRYSDMRTFTSQSPTRLEVLASDDDPTISVALGEPEYRQVLHVLDHHYNLILMDTGTGILDSATQGILRMADQIVVCAAPGIDASRASSLTLDWLDEHGYHDLVTDAVVVINQVRSYRGRELRSVADHFAKRCRAVVKVPWDPHLAEGLEVDVEDLRAETRTAYLTAAAAVARSFALPSRHR